MRAIRAQAQTLTGRRLWTRLTGVFDKVSYGPAGRFETSAAVLDHYVDGLPNLQNAIDAVPGWVGAMPPETGLVAGNSALFADTRIHWLLNECYAVAGKSVLELGPLEAFHTYMLHKAGAAEIDAVDANALAFFRCLITKEALKLDRANFLLGDFMKWLEETNKRYDLVVASGVLYHSHDPVRLLELICERADSFYLWTHYFDDHAMPRGDLRRVPFSERVETKECRGVTVRLHERSYYKAWRDPSFCGGIQDRHFWIDRHDIMALIAACGFDRIKIADDEPDHINGPSFSVFAERTSAMRVVEEPVVVVPSAEHEGESSPSAEATAAVLSSEVAAETSAETSIIDKIEVASPEPAATKIVEAVNPEAAEGALPPGTGLIEEVASNEAAPETVPPKTGVIAPVDVEATDACLVEPVEAPPVEPSEGPVSNPPDSNGELEVETKSGNTPGATAEVEPESLSPPTERG